MHELGDDQYRTEDGEISLPSYVPPLKCVGINVRLSGSAALCSEAVETHHLSVYGLMGIQVARRLPILIMGCQQLNSIW